MSGNFLVSVIIRTFERPNLLKKAIESVLNQTFKKFELIVIDDCSSDNTPEVVKAYANEDKRIRYIRNKVNIGHINTLNKAINAANGKYIALLDDDDVWLPQKLELQVSKMEKMGKDYGLVTGGVRWIDMKTGKIIKIFKPPLEGNVYWEMLQRGSSSVFGPPSIVMLRTSIVKEIGEFDENMPRGAGQDYFRTLAKRYKICKVDDILINYYVNPDSITVHNSKQDIVNEIKARKVKISHIGNDLKKFPNIYARELEKLGHFYCLIGDSIEGRKYFIKAMKRNGFNLSILGRTILSSFGSTIYKIYVLSLNILNKSNKKY